MSATHTVQEGQIAPDFTAPVWGLPDHSEVHLQALRGKIVVLYFYPKDDTPGCTTQACSFRDTNSLLQEKGTIVLGVSKDTIKSHEKFANKFSLPFPLVSDPDVEIAKAYGVYGERSMYGKTYMGVNRVTFLIDHDGVVRKVWPKVKPDGHAEDVLKAIEDLRL